ncbi:hypothetical protein FACS189446_3340 [Bacteroidia bacterium]|nr:hypothetical protein FACS189446_3340 [Bacteroidia bacterium]
MEVVTNFNKIKNMKTIYLLLISILFALFANKSIAQNAIDISKEKKYERETYVINNMPQSYLRATSQMNKSTNIYNKNKGEVEGHSAAGGCYGLKETTLLTEIFKKAISKDKIKSLAFDDKNRIFVSFIYNIKTGKVVHVGFMLQGISLSDNVDSETDITLKDINKLESLFKEYCFDVPKDCVNHETHDIYGNWNRIFWFSKLVEEEKEK